MRRTSFASLAPIALALAVASAGASGEAKPSGEASKFGKPLQGLAPTTLAQVLAKPEDGAAVRIEGTVAKVCQQKGCWIELKQGDSAVHVTFEGYSFFVPKDSAGSKVVLEGKVKVAEPDPADVEHLQKEGAGEAAARKVSIVASGVELAAAKK